MCDVKDFMSASFACIVTHNLLQRNFRSYLNIIAQQILTMEYSEQTINNCVVIQNSPVIN